MTQLTTVDKIGLYLGGGLVLLGVVGIAIVEMLLGAPHPVSGEGQIAHDALIPLAVRSYIILLGFIVWGVTAIYKFVMGDPSSSAAGIGE